MSFEQVLDYAADTTTSTELTAALSQFVGKQIPNKAPVELFQGDLGRFLTENYNMTTNSGMKAFLNDATKASPEFVIGFATSVGADGLNLMIDKTFGTSTPFWTELRRQIIAFALQMGVGAAHRGAVGAGAAGTQVIVGDFIQIGTLFIEITNMNNQTRANLNTTADQFDELARITKDQTRAQKYAVAAQQARDEMRQISSWRQYLP